MKIIMMLGGPLDGQEYEVRSIGDLGGYLIVGMPRNPKDLVKVPIRMVSGTAKYVAMWEDRENG